MTEQRLEVSRVFDLPGESTSTLSVNSNEAMASSTLASLESSQREKDTREASMTVLRDTGKYGFSQSGGETESLSMPGHVERHWQHGVVVKKEKMQPSESDCDDEYGHGPSQTQYLEAVSWESNEDGVTHIGTSREPATGSESDDDYVENSEDVGVFPTQVKREVDDEKLSTLGMENELVSLEPDTSVSRSSLSSMRRKETRHGKSGRKEKDLGGRMPGYCGICKRTVVSLHKHMVVHFRERSFLLKCDLCNKELFHHTSLKLHLKKHLRDRHCRYKCRDCDKGFRYKDAYRSHLKFHTGENPFKCNFCGKTFTRKSDLKSHKQTGTERRRCKGKKSPTVQRRLKCDVCGKTFLQKCRRKDRFEMLPGPHKCAVCSGELPANAESEDGKAEIHHECHVCGKTFNHSGHYQDHLRRHSGERPYGCPICGRRFVCQSNLRSHIKTHSREKQKRHKCNICGRKFLRTTELREHKNTGSRERLCKGDKVYRERRAGFCDICKRKVACLEKHMHFHSGEKGSSFKCELCNKDMQHYNRMKRHMEIHLKDKPFKYRCDKCDKSFYYKSLFLDHQMTHTGNKPHKCDICGQTFTRPSDLKSHKLTGNDVRRCKGEKIVKRYLKCDVCSRNFSRKCRLEDQFKVLTGPQTCVDCSDEVNMSFGIEEIPVKKKKKSPQEIRFKCDICGKRFHHSGHLLDHQRRHTGEKPYECTTCGKRFVCQSNLRCHVKTHSGEKPFTCDICGKKFTRSSDLREHRNTGIGEGLCKGDRSVSTPRYCQCEVCGKTLSCLSALLKHKKVHSTEKPYICDVCGEAFKHYNSLKYHKLTDSPNKPCRGKKGMGPKLRCNVCDREFSHSGHLQTHIMTHTGERPFQCDICDEAFLQQRRLDEHRKVHRGQTLFSCDLCELNFGSQATLAEHSLVHSKEKVYKCEICSKEFKRPSQLKAHQLTGSAKRCKGDKAQYPKLSLGCKVCGKLFAFPSQLRVHLSIHSTDRPHKCDICGETFKHPNSLRKHKRTGLDGNQCRSVVKNHKIRVVRFSQSDGLPDRIDTNIGERPLMFMKFENDEKTLSDQLAELEEDRLSPVLAKEEIEELEEVDEAETMDIFQSEVKAKENSCNVCGKVFPCPSALKTHKVVHSSVKPYTCDKCRMTSKHFYNMKYHKQNCTGEKRRKNSSSIMRFNCEICAMRFSFLIDLEAHLKTHIDVSEQRDRFDESVPCQSTLLGNGHETGETVPCSSIVRDDQSDRVNDWSTKKEVGDSDRKMFKKSVHSRGRKRKGKVGRPRVKKHYKCSDCGKAFKHLNNFRRHQKCVHSGEKPYVCEHCGEAFKHPNSLKYHKHTDFEDKPCKGKKYKYNQYECEVCGKIFSRPWDLKVHQTTGSGDRRCRRDKPKTFDCDVCGKCFNYPSLLRVHKRGHSSEKPYMCDVCGETFKHLNSLKYHKRNAKGDDLCQGKRVKGKKHECDICGKAMARPSALRIHRTIHFKVKKNADKPKVKRVRAGHFECDVCGKSFTRPTGLRDHKKTGSLERRCKGDRPPRQHFIKQSFEIVDQIEVEAIPTHSSTYQHSYGNEC